MGKCYRKKKKNQKLKQKKGQGWLIMELTIGLTMKKTVEERPDRPHV